MIWHSWQARGTRRRNAIKTTLSTIFLALLLALMNLSVISGLGTADVLVIGELSYTVLLGIVILSFPIFIFLIITIILLVIEAAGSRDKLSR